MDANVPGNNAESEEQKERQVLPFRYEQLVKMGVFNEHVVVMIEARNKALEAAAKKQQAAKEGAPPAKKPRRKFRYRVVPQVLENGTTVTTTRDLVRLMPVDKGALTVFIDPKSSHFEFEGKKEAPKEEVETVAKPRVKPIGHTLVFKTKEEEEDQQQQ